MDCLFCRIAASEVPADKVFEDDEIVAFLDIHPKAPVHILVIPRKHIESIAAATDEDQLLLGRLLRVVSQIAKDKGLTGYKTIINTGREGGQVIDHVHAHLLSGKITGTVE
jgi:histidine triad (HIT) family protein